MKSNKKDRTNSSNKQNIAAKTQKVLLNRPINCLEKDYIGIETYVEALNEAINAGAKMIGIVSDYGAGKTSLLSMYKEKYLANDREKRLIFVNLWESLDDDPESLHKHFLYHIISQLNKRKGSYISKRLSPNYGLISIQGETLFKTISIIGSIALFLAGIFINHFNSIIQHFFQITEQCVTIISQVCILIALVFAVLIFLHSDVVFSSNKSEGKRVIDSNTLTDYFNQEILRKGHKKTYIIAIEDLDRIKGKARVNGFLKEIIRYYLSDQENIDRKKQNNKVVFVVCIKPEEKLLMDNELAGNSMNKPAGEEEIEDSNIAIKEKRDNSTDRLYDKYFDYIININSVNIDNYDSILNGLLNEISDSLIDLGLVKNRSECQFDKIDGMSWIIHGKKLGIREIKNRLNLALNLYKNLTTKFTNNSITFEKCAVAVYLMREYGEDFYKLKDDSFDQLIGQYLENRRNKEKGHIELDIDISDEFEEVVNGLISAKLIDSTYRTYFYNYPKDSKTYSNNELMIYNSIVYFEGPQDGDDEYEETLKLVNDEVIFDAFNRLNLLKLDYPTFLLSYEKTIDILANSYKEKLYALFDALIFDLHNFRKSTQYYTFFYSKYRDSEDEELLIRVGKSLLTIDDYNIFVYVRQEICKVFKKRMHLLGILYGEDKPFLTLEEIKLLGDPYMLTSLSNYEMAEGKEEECYEIHKTILLNTGKGENHFDTFYENMLNIQEQSQWITYLCEYIIHVGTVSSKLVELFNNAIVQEVCEEKTYIDAISTFDKWTDEQIEEIITLNWTGGLPEKLCNYLYSKGYIKLFVANAAITNVELIDLMDKGIIESIRTDGEWLLKYAEKALSIIRKTIIKDRKLIKVYSFLFDNPFNFLDENEIRYIDNYEDVIFLLEDKTISKSNIVYISEYFNSSDRDGEATIRILDFVLLYPKLVHDFFYSLTFLKESYRKINPSNRMRLENKFFPLFGIPANKEELVRYLHFTNRANQNIEKDLYIYLNENPSICDMYVEFVNNLTTINSVTLRNIRELTKSYVYSNTVNRKLFDSKEYSKYIYSNYLKEHIFCIDSKVNENMWADYIRIFHSKSDELVKAMMENSEFMNHLVIHRSYLQAGNAINKYCVAMQTVDLVDYIFTNLSEQDIIAYFSKIGGFFDYDAAHHFVKLVIGKKRVLASDVVYSECHEKLLNSGIQSWYTRERNKMLGL